MDSLDAVILRELGAEPFAGWGHRPLGLRATEVAKALGRSVRLVQDRITRMEKEGVIAGYACIPNPRHFGLGLTTFHVPTPRAADQEGLRAFGDLDGFVQVIAYLGSGVCLSMSHTSLEERDRRLGTVARLAGGEAPRPMYEHALPPVQRELTNLDWRIIAALVTNAKRAPADVAEEVGVTTKTVRTRLAKLREEGSIDELAIVDFRRMEGLMPFEIAVWCHEEILPALQERLREHYWGHFVGPKDGYCDVLFRVFTATPAEAQGLVAAVGRIPGVERAEALMAAGLHEDHRWLQEAIATRIAKTGTVSA